MTGELILRFVVGGTVVSAFAFLGEKVKPKTLAGIFAAAPSVALATLALTAATHARADVVRAGRSMVGGAVALLSCTVLCAALLRRTQLPVRAAAVLGWLAWALVAGIAYAGVLAR